MFSGRNGLLIKGVVTLAVVWAVVWGLLQVTGAMKPSPEKVEAYIEKNSLEEIEDPEERKVVIAKMAKMLNQLEGGDLREMFGGEENEDREGPPDFVQSMTPEEQRYFMELRLGKAFEQMMVAFNEMEREDRKKIVDRTLRQMSKDSEQSEGMNRLEDEDPEMAEKMINEGLKAYYQDASAETKIDLAPVLEQMQKNLRFQHVHGRSGDRK